MKLLVIGSRSITDFDLSPHIPHNTELIISGGANGIDLLAEQFADKYKISKLIIRPKYNLYRKNAPLKRNEQMVEICDSVLALWDGKSRGTKYTIDYAAKSGKPIKIITLSKN